MSTIANTITTTIKAAGYPLYPIEIAEKGGLNHNTVRRAVRELTASGQLFEKFYGNGNRACYDIKVVSV
jgi:DNA-binding GntR family transcriptional regulator